MGNRGSGLTAGAVVALSVAAAIVALVVACGTFSAEESGPALPDANADSTVANPDAPNTNADAGEVATDATTSLDASNEHLVGYWPFDEGQGAAAQDLTGHGHNLAFEGSAAFSSTGKVGGALRVLSAGGVARGPSLNGTKFPQTSGTIAVWVMLEEAPTQFQAPASIVDTWDDIGTVRPHIFLRVPNAGVSQIQIAGQAPSAAPGFVFVWDEPWGTTQWMHLAVTWGNSEVKIYKDRVLADVQTLNGFAPSEEEFVVGQAFRGYIDELRLYDIALSVIEINSLP